MLIGLTGRKQAGKDTVYGRAAHIMRDVLPVERASFADLLYQSAAAALGVTVAELRAWKEDTRFHVEVTCEDPTVNGYAPLVSLTFREYLQRYGTEAHRQVFGDDFWVEHASLEHAGKLVFVTDVRFDNEAEAVRKAGGIVVRVDAPRSIEESGDGHASEAGVSAHLIDGRLPNYVRDDGFRALDDSLGSLLRNAFIGA